MNGEKYLFHVTIFSRSRAQVIYRDDEVFAPTKEIAGRLAFSRAVENGHLGRYQPYYAKGADGVDVSNKRMPLDEELVTEVDVVINKVQND